MSGSVLASVFCLGMRMAGVGGVGTQVAGDGDVQLASVDMSEVGGRGVVVSGGKTWQWHEESSSLLPHIFCFNLCSSICSECSSRNE